MRWCQVMSLTTRSKNCYYCCIINSALVVFDRCCFAYKFYISNQGGYLSNWEIWSSTIFELKSVRFLDFLFIVILEQIRIFPFETAPPVNAIFKKNDCKCGRPGYCKGIYSISLRPVDQQRSNWLWGSTLCVIV